MTVSARSNRALAQFWWIVFAATAAIMVVLELAMAPARPSAGAADQSAEKSVIAPKTARQTAHTLLAAG